MADVALPAGAERGFRIGAVLHGAAIAVARNALPFCLVSGIATLPSLLVSHDASVSATEWVWTAVGLILFLAFGAAPHTLLRPAVGVALGMVLGALSQAILIQGTLAHMRGRPVKAIASVQMAQRVFFAVIGAEICSSVLCGLGFFMLIVPGFILMTMLYVAVPACIVEQLGPWKSLRRSATLVSGNGWKVFGVIVVVSIVEAIGSRVTHTLDGSAGPAVGLIANLSWAALDGVFSAALVAATYHGLRVTKEGVDIDQLARVFD